MIAILAYRNWGRGPRREEEAVIQEAGRETWARTGSRYVKLGGCYI